MRGVHCVSVRHLGIHEFYDDYNIIRLLLALDIAVKKTSNVGNVAAPMLRNHINISILENNLVLSYVVAFYSYHGG